MKQLPGVLIQAGDLTNLTYCSELLANADGVIHCAGVSRVSSAKNAPLDAMQSTMLASGNLFETIRNQGNKWLVVVSTREVENQSITKEPNTLEDLYGICKTTVEQLARCFCLGAGTPLVICRLSDVYGSPSDHANKLLPVFLTRSLAGSPLEIRDTTTRFCFTHINDVVTGISEAVEQLETGKVTFQLRKIWGDRWVTAPELAQLIKKTFASESEHVVSPPTLRDKIEATADDALTWNFTETISLEEGIKQMSGFRG